ncbi:class II aldolase/adducin family protein [Sediminispirochaeta smaragdinae]|uniref:Class II aldolase/adducin family protein n=1 Tax=Sediminispirochaeta smaragdinae (strain DSM 11293 / JCM 15392 / SEBR 4228) TaxID=573413 RepID=E1RAK7_SEDSS|nr:class II aldolase/adducin family protein [Sediminispirochaeta smaragdinae]ADK82375.1 class II aldolase/adducin family protein [Sediminispirochaeta smaragdinae DSM 11293]
MRSGLSKKYKIALWVAKSLFERNKVSGSSANMSFRHNGLVYITASNTCFGSLTSRRFSVVDIEGNRHNGITPSKELPLHLLLYKKSENIQAVIHTHSFYSTLWSCLDHSANTMDVIPNYTPYLRMKLGSVGLVPYAKPGSRELFEAFQLRLDKSDGFLLEHHGPIVGGADLESAFYILEELEESARVAWMLRNVHAQVLP